MLSDGFLQVGRERFGRLAPKVDSAPKLENRQGVQGERQVFTDGAGVQQFFHRRRVDEILDEGPLARQLSTNDLGQLVAEPGI